MKLSSKTQGHLIMLIVMIVFGLNIPVNKYLYAAEYIPPLGMTAARMTFAAIMFWLVSLFMPKEKVGRKDLLVLVGGGLCGMLCNQGLFAYGLGLTSSVDASIITTSGPLFAMIMAAIILREPITMQKAGGVLVGGIGAVILILSASQMNLAGTEGSMKGNLCIFSAQLFYSFYLVVTRPLANKYSPITMMKWMFLPSALIALLFFGKDMVYAPVFHQTDFVPLLLLSFTLFGATFFTYMMIPLAQRRIRPTTISMYNNLQPLITTIVAVVMINEKITLMKLVASLFIFVGVYLVTTSKSKADLDAEKVSK